MTEVVFALLLLMNNEIKEARIQDSLSICLKHKREAERQQSNVTYKCIKSKAELEKNIDGSITIKKLILE
tara:strand:+ start:391 stop:600 length:210 start_codon:yes stop_codon:yes gene_type:complete